MEKLLNVIKRKPWQTVGFVVAVAYLIWNLGALLGALILIGVSLVGYVCGEELWREYKSVPASKAPKARKSKKK